MANKPRQKEFTSHKENKYVFQSVPNSTFLEIMDNCTNEDGKPIISKLYPSVLEHIVVQPNGLNVDDFENFNELREVCENALTFQQS